MRSSKKPVRAPPEPKRVLKGEIGEEMKRYTATLLGEKGNKAGAYEAKVKALAAIPRLLTKSHESGQFDLVLETILKGIRNVIAGPHPAAEFAVNKAAHLAIDTIKCLLEPRSKEMELVACTLLVPLLKVTEKVVQGAKQWAERFGELAVEIAELAPPTPRVTNCLVPELLTNDIKGINACLYAADCLGTLVAGGLLEPIVSGLKHLMQHPNREVRAATMRSIGELAAVDEVYYEGLFCKAFPQREAGILEAIAAVAAKKRKAAEEESGVISDAKLASQHAINDSQFAGSLSPGELTQ